MMLVVRGRTYERFTAALADSRDRAMRWIVGGNALLGICGPLRVIRDWVEPGEGPAMSAMLRKRK